MFLTQLYVKLLLISFIILSILCVVIPNPQNLLAQEDGFLENLSALLFFISFFLGTIIIRKLSAKKIISSHHNSGYFCIPLISLLGFLDEISFGERIFNFQFIQVIDGLKLDGIHDIISLAYKFLILKLLRNQLNNGDYSFLSCLLFCFVLAILLLIRYYRPISNFMISSLKQHLSFRFFLIMVIFFFLATLIDIGVFFTLTNMGMLTFLNHDILSVYEELLETYVALSCLFMTLAIHYQHNQKFLSY